ncbi:MAG: hypothetical protein ACRYGF_18390 [Janthinobacterium lividum]
MPVVLWAGFVHWGYKRDQERPPSWAWNYKKTSWAEDVNEFTRELCDAVKFCAARWRAGGTICRKDMAGARECESVSPSVAIIPEKKMVVVLEPKPAIVAAAPSPSRSPRFVLFHHPHPN